MKKNLLVFTAVIFSFYGYSSNPYRPDDAAIEALFSASVDITGELSGFLPDAGLRNQCSAGYYSPKEEDKQTTAGIIAIAQFVTGTGFIPIYRFMLGTGENNGKVFGLYCVTCGGLGVLPLIDAIMLLTDDSENKYINNQKFIMWLD